MPELGALIEEHLKESSQVLAKAAEEQSDIVAGMAERILATLRSEGKLLVFGNGGSAADSQHFAAELTARYARNRRPLPAIALTVNSSDLTAISNDFGYDDIFERPLRALARSEDLAFAISTSGNSPNVIKAVQAAKELGLTVLGLSGGTGGKLAPLCDRCFISPSKVVAHIQEAHIAVIHTLCLAVEETLFPHADKAH